MTSLQIHLLGDFTLKHDGELITAVISRRLQSVLAYLLLQNSTPQLRHYLAYQLWPDSTERQARNNLRKALHQLRRALPDVDHLLYVDEQVVQWRPRIAYFLDIAEFESKLSQAKAIAPDDLTGEQRSLEEAVALYHGDLLPGCYDEWIMPTRERLRQLFMEALERLTWLAEEQREYATAVRHAQHLLQYDPFHETTYRHLMRLYMLDGNRASALRTTMIVLRSCKRNWASNPVQRCKMRMRN